MQTIYQSFILVLIASIMIGCSDQDIKQEDNLTLSGEEVFRESCISCHSSDTIAGGSYKLQAEKLQKDFKEKENLHNFVVRNMPENDRGSLSKEEYIAVVNYLWTQKK
jgi:mono/diheme cytochrome c family protein